MTNMAGFLTTYRRRGSKPNHRTEPNTPCRLAHWESACRHLLFHHSSNRALSATTSWTTLPCSNCWERSLARDCADGHEALRAFSEFRPDWTIMDLAMPRVDGLAATRQI